MSRCIDPELLVAFASGRLDAETNERVESHADGCASCRAAIAAVANLDASGSSRSAPGAARRLQVLDPGTSVGRYRVVELIAAGGMGVVYRATDPTLNRAVALKLVRPDRGGDTERLLAEAKAMARVVHPEVLPVYDAGQLGDQLFIAMEWVQGRTLRSALRAGLGSWRERVALFVRAGRGLAAAHRAGLVHRDFKPENVLLGDDGRLRVGDFGLAHDAAEPGAGGTAAFMAPELLRGEPATAASDQYAFCVALREALAGVRSVPSAVQRTVERGLAVAPRDRHPSMDALLSELERLVRPRGPLWLVAGASAAALAAVVTVAWLRAQAQRCVGGAEQVSAVWNPQRRATLVAAAPEGERATAARIAGLLDAFAGRWAATHRDACEATFVRHVQSDLLMDLRFGCLQQKLSGVGALLGQLERPGPETYEHAIEATEEAVALGRCSDVGWLTAAGGARLPAEARATAAALRERLSQARALLRVGPPEQGLDRARTLVREALAARTKAVEGEAHLLVAEFLERLRSRPEEGAEIDRELDDAVLAGIEAQFPHLLAEAWLSRMRTCIEDARFEEAEKAEKSLAANLRALGHDPSLEGEHQLSLASLRMRQSKLTESLEAYDRAARQLAQLPAEEARLLASRVYLGRALVELTLGLIDGAATHLELALTADEERFGPDHPALAELHHNLSDAELARDRPDAALQHLARAQQLWAAAYGPENPRIGVNLVSRAQALAATQRSPEALDDLAEARRLFTASHLDRHFVFMRALCTEGDVRLGQRDLAGAARALRSGLELSTEAGAYPLDEAECHRGLGEVLLAQGKLADARAELQLASDHYAKLGAVGPWVARVTVDLAELDLREGQRDRAIAALREALSQPLDGTTRARAQAALDEGAATPPR